MTLTEYDIVIPTFREEAYIEKLFESLKNQTIKPHKIIVVDFKSGEDKTAEIANKYGAKVVPTNIKGIGEARALGYNYVDCKYVFNIDGDSEPKPDVVEKLLKPIVEGRAVATYAKGVWNPGDQFWDFFTEFWGLHKFIIPDGQCFAGVMVLKEAYDTVGGFQPTIWEDTNLCLRLSWSYPGQVLYIPEAQTITSDRRVKGMGKNIFSHLDYTKAYREKNGVEELSTV